MLAQVYEAEKFKIPGQAVLIVLGALLVGLGVFLMIRAKKFKRQEELGVEKADYKRMHNATDIGDINKTQQSSGFGNSLT